MVILVSNDDGYFAAGLQPLVDHLSAIGEVWVVAPETEQSAKSHGFTMHEPLRVRRHKERWYSVNGTPADCVYVALHHVLPERPALVVSGINRGSNLGNDVLYSGTVAAAMEGCLAGIPSIAVSLYIDFEAPLDTLNWDTAAHVALGLSRDLLANGTEPRTLLNLNVPDLPADELEGVVACRLGERVYDVLVDVRKDPRGRSYLWIGGKHHAFADIERSDGPLTERGYATVTPLSADLTDYRALASLGAWSSFRD
jgi:5'-nucleotidase